MKTKHHSPGFISCLGALMTTLLTGAAVAHDDATVGLPVCLEGNFMVADFQGAPFSSVPGPGRVLEMNIFTGKRGITVDSPFASKNLGTPIIPEGVVADGPWGPTGVLSGGINGHAFIPGSLQHTLTEFHRDGTPIRSVRLLTAADPSVGFNAMPSLNGTQFMPNGNLIQAVCDHNVVGSPSADPNTAGYNPPLWSTPERAKNSRLLVIEPDTLQVIDEYNAPDDPRWSCPAGIIFSDEGMFVSTFHGAAVFVIDWKAGAGNTKKPGKFKKDDLNKSDNQMKVVRVIDMLGPDAPMDDPRRRDSLRDITLDESGNLYAAFRDRARQPSIQSPADFRQHIAVVPKGHNYPTRTIAMDHGVQVIAGMRVNRMTGPGCEAVNPGHTDPHACDIETLLVGASAMNPGGCDGTPGGCFRPGGGVAEYRIMPEHADGPECRDQNIGCAKPIATFFGTTNGEDNIDPRMLMIIHGAFVQ